MSYVNAVKAAPVIEPDERTFQETIRNGVKEVSSPSFARIISADSLDL